VPARQTLWDLRTLNQMSGGKRIAEMALDEAYKAWSYIMDRNQKQRKQLLPPIAPLDAFVRLDPSRKDWD
jgi:hypothetical protein